MPRPLRLLLLPLVVLTLVFSSATVPAHAAGTDTWTKWNLGDTWIRSLDYVNGTQLVAGSENSGVYTASSALGPWTNISGNLSTLGKQVRQAVGQSGQIYLATSAGLFKGSGNGSWSQIGNDDSVPSYQRLNQGGVQTVRFPTGSASYLVVGTSGSGRDGIFYSSDSGKHWTKAGGFTGGAYYMVNSGSTMYVAGSTGFWKSTDSGKNWTLRSDGIPPGESAKRIAINPVNSNYLIAATVGGVYRSDNAGASWYDASGSGAGLLNASEVRAFQLVPSAYWNGAIPRIVVGTNNGVWATSDGGLNWAKMSPDKANGGEVSMGSESVYALNIGFGTPGFLIAGTQGHGIFRLPLQVAAPPGTIPAPSGTTIRGYTLIANTNTAAWTGTTPFAFAFQWKRCTNDSSTTDANCPDIDGANGPTYQLTASDVGKYIRVVVSGRSLVQQSYTDKLSNPTAVVAAPPLPIPQPPTNYPRLDGDNSAPWGATFTVNESDDGSERWRVNGSYDTTVFTYSWYRCTGNDCDKLPNSGRSYTSTVEDVGHTIKAGVVGRIDGQPSDEWFTEASGSVYEKKPVNTSAPKIVGKPYVGQVLNSTVGTWKGTNPTYARRWFKCDSKGGNCSLTNVTTPNYLVQAGDKGFTMRVEVKATVVDQFQARVSDPVMTAPTPVIGAALPSCAVVTPALAAAVAAVVQATKAVKAKKKKLKKAKKSGKKAKIKKAKKALKKAKQNLASANAKKKALQALSTAAAC